jgi:hypothetical protein
MKNTINELQSLLNEYSIKFAAISEPDFSHKPLPTKWSKKEVVGHLIDSAQNNLRRFIVAQYEPQPKIVYDQDFWVNANGYQQMKKEEVISLWKLVNERICSVWDPCRKRISKKKAILVKLKYNYTHFSG